MFYVPEVFKLPFAAPFWVVFFVAFLREGKVVRGAMEESDAAQDKGTFKALMIGSSIATVVAVAVAFVPALIFPHHAAAVWFGITLIAAGALLRRMCFAALGESFAGVVSVREHQTVIQSGPYRLVRHPSYTAAFLMFIGLGVGLGNGIGLLLLFVVHCFLYGRRVSVEEAALLATLGEPYRTYMSRTKRFIPYLI